MKRALVGALAVCLIAPSLGSGDGSRDASANATSGSRPYKVKATVVSANLQTMQLTYLDATTGASGSATLSSKAATQLSLLKSGVLVTLELRAVASSNTLVVESINKQSHKQLVILGLVLLTVVAGSALLVSGGPI